ncbi:MAG: hypothetical protein H6737_20910 [Alphaproteobacteria bacterium]|nr:hypothetical protein [Alphaproteobacteria bacterium]
MSALFLLLACGGTSEAPPVSFEVVEPDPLPPAPRAVHRPRSLRLEAAWGAGSPPCDPPCAMVSIARLEASSERGGDVAGHAIDGDLATAWCGERGRKDQILARFAQPSDVAAVVVHARGVAKIALTSSEWDEAIVTLGAPIDGAAPPWVPLGFSGSELVNVEIVELHDGGPGCIEEIAFVGVPEP